MEKTISEKEMSEIMNEAMLEASKLIASLMAFIDYKGEVAEYNKFKDKFYEYMENDKSEDFDRNALREYIEKDGCRDA